MSTKQVRADRHGADSEPQANTRGARRDRHHRLWLDRDRFDGRRARIGEWIRKRKPIGKRERLGKYGRNGKRLGKWKRGSGP
jgi:hypothetical protein